MLLSKGGEVNGALRRIGNISAIRDEIKVKVWTIHVVHVCGMWSCSAYVFMSCLV